MAVHFPGSVADFLKSVSGIVPLSKTTPWSIGGWVDVIGPNTPATYNLFGFYGSGDHRDSSLVVRWSAASENLMDTMYTFGRTTVPDDSWSLGPGPVVADPHKWRLVVLTHDGSGTVSMYVTLENQTANFYESRTLNNDVTDATHSPDIYIGGFAVGSTTEFAPECSQCQFFIAPDHLTEANITSLAAGATIGSLGKSPLYWYTLDDETDTANKGTESNDLVANGAITAISGPSVLYPTAPTTAPGITSVTPGANSASVVYTAADGAVGYEYQLDGGAWLPLPSGNPAVITGLAESTQYSLKLRGVNPTGTGPASTATSFTTDVPDSVAPVLTSATASATGNTTADASVSTSEGEGTLYWVVLTSATAPTAAEVQAGQGAGGGPAVAGGSSPVVASGTQMVDLSGLSKNTAYYVYFQQDDAAGNRSSVVSSAAFTTLDLNQMALQGDFDGSNLDVGATTITNPGAAQPAVSLEMRTPDGKWRQFYFRAVNVGGKRPTFSFDESGSSTSSIAGSWRPWYSYDRKNWVCMEAAPARSGNIVSFQFAAAFAQDVVYIGLQPGYPVGNVPDFISDVSAAHPGLIHKLPSGGGTHQSGTLSSSTDENGRTIPALPLYSFGVWDPTAYPGDGYPKRTVVLTGGIHAGEHMAGYALEACVRFILGTSPEAESLREHFQFYVYPMLNPNGRWGGAQRYSLENQYRDPNRDWETFTLELTQKARAAFAKDFPGRKVVLLYDFHTAYDTNKGGEPMFIWDNNWMDDASSARMDTALSMEGDYLVHTGSDNEITINRWMYRTHQTMQSHTPELMGQESFPDGMASVNKCGEDLARALYNLLTVAPSDMAYAGDYIAEALGGAGSVPQVCDAAVYPWPPSLGDALITFQRGVGADASRNFRMDLGSYTGTEAFVVISSAAYETNKDNTASGANVVSVKVAP